MSDPSEPITIEASSGSVFADLGLVTPEMIDILWHSLGMTKANHRKPIDWWLDNDNHRNHFCTSVTAHPANADQAKVLGLVKFYLMEAGRTINDGRDRYYHVTAEGIALAKREMAERKPWNKGGVS